MLGLYVAVGWVLFTIPKTESMGEEKMPVLRQLKESVTMLASNRALVAALTITVSLNFFGFPFLTMVPVIGRDVLGANAFLYGILAGAAGVGSLTGAIIIASRQIRNHGQVYSLGSAFMLGIMVLFALSEWYTVSLVLLMVAGLGMAGFRHDAADNCAAGGEPGDAGTGDGRDRARHRRESVGDADGGMDGGAGEPGPSGGVGGADGHRIRCGDGAPAYAAGAAWGNRDKIGGHSTVAQHMCQEEFIRCHGSLQS